jgi:hypothetical protein
MAALGSQSIASSYEQLLHVDADGGGNGTTHVSVKDGDNGTTFGFTIATDALMMTGTNRLEFGDTGTYIHQSADGVLDLVSDTELELNATTIDMNGAVDISGDTTSAGNLTLTKGDASNNLVFNAALSSAADNIALIDGKWNNNLVSRISFFTGSNTTDDNDGGIGFATRTSGGSLSERMRIDTVGNLGIGDTDPSEAKLSIDNVQSGDVGIKINQTQSQASIELTGNGSIKFPGTQGASSDANSLDDYEEGSFDIAVAMASGSATINGSFNRCSYTKIGRLVTITGECNINAVSSPSGEMTITGLPFASAASLDEGSDRMRTAGMQLNAFTSGDDGAAVIVLSDNASSFTVKTYDNTNPVPDSSCEFGFSFSYISAT